MQNTQKEKKKKKVRNKHTKDAKRNRFLKHQRMRKSHFFFKDIFQFVFCV